MTQELSRKPTTFSDTLSALTAKTPWQRVALALVLILSAFLNLFRLSNAGYGTIYYAAAVKDMLTSWHNLFFVSFDAGFVTVDKPPLGLWIQAASAELFGFSGWSLLLPQALAGVLSVALLYHLVRRAFGPVAGLLAALALAVTPIAVSVERTNNSDGLLTLTVLVAAWAVIRAAETGRLRWLVVGAVVVGLGFNIKMMEAYLVLPALYLLYLLASPVSWRRRFAHLGIATVVLLAVSLSWAVAVDLTPADQRPYVGDSPNNSELELAFGYNGATRLLGMGQGAFGGGEQPTQEASAAQGDAQGGGGFGRETGNPGPLRLLNEQLAGQIGWLLPLAVVGLLVAGWQNRPRSPLDRQCEDLPPRRRYSLRPVAFFEDRLRLRLDRKQGALVLWGTWLLTTVAFFSVAGMFHRYYMVMIAPAIAALVGIGVTALWSDYRGAGWRGWLLPLTLLGMATLHAYIILVYYNEDWGRWLTLVIVGLCLVAAAGLAFLRLRPRLRVSAYSAGVAVAVGVLALLVAPTVWAAYNVWQGNRSMSACTGPACAGPRTVQDSSSGGRGGGPPSDKADPMLLDYLQTNRGDARYLVATINSFSAAPIILSTDYPDPVIDLGGFVGSDPVLSTARLANLVKEGEVRFFLLGQDHQSSQNKSMSWVQDNCQEVPGEQWQSSSASEQSGDPGESAPMLYDCSTYGSG